MKAVDIRMEQFRTIGRFMSRLTRETPPEDLILLVGDLNEDSRVCEVKEEEEGEGTVRIEKGDDISNNYRRMLTELGNNGEFAIRDLIHVRRGVKCRSRLGSILLLLEELHWMATGRSTR